MIWLCIRQSSPNPQSIHASRLFIPPSLHYTPYLIHNRLTDYAHQRYGSVSNKVNQAWFLLQGSVYNCTDDHKDHNRFEIMVRPAKKHLDPYVSRSKPRKLKGGICPAKPFCCYTWRRFSYCTSRFFSFLSLASNFFLHCCCLFHINLYHTHFNVILHTSCHLARIGI